MNKSEITDTNLSEEDLKHLQRCLELAQESLEAGDKPFGSILVDSNNQVIAEARNKVNELTPLAHPEFELAQWAAENLNVDERKNTTMYTSGEHCPMCSAAHAWVGLGTIVYLSAAKQLTSWLKEINAPESPIKYIPIQEIIVDYNVRGPAEGEMLSKIKELQLAYYKK